MKKVIVLLIIGWIAISVTSCSVSSHSMMKPNNYIEFTADDFEYSNQVSGEATEIKILGIDWARLFDKKFGEFQGGSGEFEIPIIGGIIGSQVNGYALYNIMMDNKGYDVVLFPQYETKSLNIIVMKTTSVKVTARLGKLKK